MRAFVDLAGQRFGKWTVLERCTSDGSGTMWRCRCDCGRIVIVRGKHLRQGISKSCGCSKRKERIIRTCRTCGKQFTILPSRGQKGNGQFCSRRCRKLAVERTCPTCGVIFFAHLYSVRSGQARFCSNRCRRREAERTCLQCNTVFLAKPHKMKGDKGRRFCSRACAYQYHRGPRHPRFVHGLSGTQEYPGIISRQTRATRPQSAIAHRLNVSLTQALRSAGLTKTDNTFILVGCTPLQLKTHIERQFLKGMTWENRHLWHIDHVRPCAQFDLTDPVQRRTCFHFTNLRPLWASSRGKVVGNLNKRDKHLYLI